MKTHLLLSAAFQRIFPVWIRVICK